MTRFSPAVCGALGFYVYLYIRPDTGEVFYVGKGKGNRALDHIDGQGHTPHDEIVHELNRKKLKPTVEILIHGLATEKEAFAVEMAAIDLLGLNKLANRVHGHEKKRRGRMTLEQIRCRYDSPPAVISEPAILIRIAQAFRYGMSGVELYDATRSSWVVAQQRRVSPVLALAVFEGVVKEVYHIQAWLPAGSTFRTDYPAGLPSEGRLEFVGRRAEDHIRSKYLNRSVASYFPAKSQNPIRYVNC